MERLIKATKLIKHYHKGQKRDDDKDYEVHLMNVFHLLTLVGADFETQLAGILHDILESLPQYVNGKPEYALTCVKLENGWWVGYMDEDGGNHPDLEAFNADTLVNALCILKIWLIKNNYIIVNK